MVPGTVQVGAAANATLPASLVRQMRTLRVPQDSSGLLVADLQSGDVLWSLNPGVPRNPASVMKLVTTFVALDRLGPGYRWPTEAWVDGTVPRGSATIGDLYLKGFGNPFWVSDDFTRFGTEIELLGTRTITGDLVLDTSYYAPSAGSPGDFDGKEHRVYNVMPHPLAMNFNSVRFVMVPDPQTGELRIRTQPELTNLVIDSAVRVEPKACRTGNISLRMNVGEVIDGMTRVGFAGRFPSRCPNFELTRAVLSHEEQLVGAFTALWRQRGGEIRGTWRSGTVPEKGRLLHRQMSAPLGDLIRSANKFSNNVMVRQIFLTVGADAYGAPATLDKARLAAAQSLADNGLQFAELEIDNGSGLSRTARIAPESLLQLLQQAWRHRYGSDFFGSLPVPGVDGTLESRFPRGEYVGQAYVKTGTLDDVTALAGLVQANSGRRYLVAFIVNHTNVHRGAGRALQKTLLRLLVTEG